MAAVRHLEFAKFSITSRGLRQNVILLLIAKFRISRTFTR